MKKLFFAAMATILTATIAAAGTLTVERGSVQVEGEATWVPAWFVKDRGRLVDVLTDDDRTFAPFHGRVAVRHVASIDNIFDGREAGEVTGARVLLVNGGGKTVDAGPDGIKGTADDIIGRDDYQF